MVKFINRRLIAFGLTTTAIAGSAVAFVVYTDKEQSRYIQSHLEPNAPFLGLAPVLEIGEPIYEDRDRNGSLETYVRMAIEGDRIFRVVRESDGSYKLTPTIR